MIRLLLILSLISATFVSNAQLLFYQCGDSLAKSNFIYDIKMADQGYLYIANDNGLLASDGVKSWYVYNENNLFPQQILSTNPLKIILNSGDTIDVKTSKSAIRNQELAVSTEIEYSVELDPNLITVKSSDYTYHLKPSEFQRFNDYTISANGSLWIAESRHLYLNHLGSDALIDLKIGDNYQDVGVNCVEIIGNNLWIGTNGYGLFYLNLSELYYSIEDSKGLIPLGQINGKNIVSDDYNIYTLELDVNNFEHATTPIFTSKTPISVIANDSAIIVITNGFASIIDENGTVKKLYALQSFEANGISTFFRDTLYLGSNANGIMAIAPNNSRRFINTSNGLLHNQVLGFSKSADRLLAYSKKGGISDVNATSNYIDYKNNNIQGNIKSVSKIRDEWWVCTEGYGVKIFDANLNFVASIDPSNAINSGYVLSILLAGKSIYGIQPRDLFQIENNQISTIDPSAYISDIMFTGRFISTQNEALILETNKDLLVRNSLFKDTVIPVNIHVKNTLINGYPISDKTPLGTSNTAEITLDIVIPSPLSREFSLYYELNGDRSTKTTLIGKKIKLYDLNYGSHNLIVKSSSGQLLLDYKFKIGRAFYLQPLFWIAVLLILILIVYAIARWRIKIIKSQNEELEKRIAERTTEIQEKSQLLEQISFTLSHDLKTPAHNIIELSKIMEARIEGSQKFSKLFDEAGRQILLKTLDTLEILRSDSGNAAQSKLSNLKMIFESAIQPLRFQIEKKDAQINIEIPDNTEITVKRPQWQSVFFNLVSNSLKYSTPNIQPIITIKYNDDDNYQYISITDNGIGVDTSKVDVFDRFSTGDSSGASTGVGLTLVKQIIESHNGTITLASEPGNGAQFTIRLKK